MTLHGILPPDAGRLERAARRYAIAVLSEQGSARSGLWRAREVLTTIPELWGAAPPAESTSYDQARLLRARVALYLRWCERVERMRYGTAARPLWPGSHGWHASGYRLLPAGHDGFPVVAPVWAVPLWTLAPAHDPAVGPAERRNRRPKA